MYDISMYLTEQSMLKRIIDSVAIYVMWQGVITNEYDKD